MSGEQGVPITLFHEAEGHIVTVELKTGTIYRGKLSEAEDTMNCMLKEVVMTAKDGRSTRMEEVYIRGGHVKLIILPDLLKNAPILKKVNALKRKGETESSSKGHGDGGRSAKRARK